MQKHMVDLVFRLANTKDNLVFLANLKTEVESNRDFDVLAIAID